MGERQMMIQTVPASEARRKFGELLKRVYHRQVRVIVEKGGIPVAALVSLADLERCIGGDLEREMAEPPSTASRGVRAMARETLTIQPPTRQQVATRQALVENILANAEKRVISPLTTADLVHKVREERVQAYERWAR